MKAGGSADHEISSTAGNYRDFTPVCPGTLQYQTKASPVQAMSVAGCRICGRGRQPDQNRDKRTKHPVGALEAQVTRRVRLENG
jgi:hypothetical protein